MIVFVLNQGTGKNRAKYFWILKFFDKALIFFFHILTFELDEVCTALVLFSENRICLIPIIQLYPINYWL